MIDSNLRAFFHSLFPKDLFELRFGKGVNIRSKNYMVTVTCEPSLFFVTHEMAHLIEAPNADIFKNDVGLGFPEYLLTNSELKAQAYKTEVPFKRELRVYGIQYALAHYAKVKHSLKLSSEHLTNYMITTAKINLVGSQSHPKPFMCPTLLEKPIADICIHIENKMFEYSKAYPHTKLPVILDRKFNYMREQRRNNH